VWIGLVGCGLRRSDGVQTRYVPRMVGLGNKKCELCEKGGGGGGECAVCKKVSSSSGKEGTTTRTHCQSCALKVGGLVSLTISKSERRRRRAEKEKRASSSRADDSDSSDE